MKYEGSCHCGRVRFEVEGEIDGAMACNCSICQRKGSLLWFVPREKLHLHTPENDAATYMFNKHVIKHRFCPVCGIHPYGEARTQRETQRRQSTSGVSRGLIWRLFRFKTTMDGRCDLDEFMQNPCAAASIAQSEIVLRNPLANFAAEYAALHVGGPQIHAAVGVVVIIAAATTREQRR